jgi:hypothetical protein
VVEANQLHYFNCLSFTHFLLYFCADGRSMHSNNMHLKCRFYTQCSFQILQTRDHTHFKTFLALRLSLLPIGMSSAAILASWCCPEIAWFSTIPSTLSSYASVEARGILTIWADLPFSHCFVTEWRIIGPSIVMSFSLFSHIRHSTSFGRIKVIIKPFMTVNWLFSLHAPSSYPPIMRS